VFGAANEYMPIGIKRKVGKRKMGLQQYIIAAAILIIEKQ
jgi:hypothetical protein